MHFGTMINEAFDAMIVTPLSPDRANMFSMCFPDEVTNYDMLMDPGDGTYDVTLYDACDDEMDTVGIGHILDVTLHGPHFTFDLSGVLYLRMMK